jgi:hypothetical protein
MKKYVYLQFHIKSNLDNSIYHIRNTRKFINSIKTYERFECSLYKKNKKDNYCVDINLYFKDNIIKAEVSQLKYDKECSIQKTLEKGIGTQNMFLTMLALISKMYPDIESFQFKDFSEKTCDNGANIHLGYFSLITSGKTWYEKNFGAILQNPIIRKIYYEDKNKFNKKDIIGVDISEILSNINKPLKEIILNEYNNSISYRDFFNNLNIKFGRNMSCEYLQPWIQKFMIQLNFEQYFHMDWIIPIEELNKKNINIIYSKIISKNKNFKNTNFTRNNKKRNNYNI